MDDSGFMQMALEEAMKCVVDAESGPPKPRVGVVVVKNDVVIAKAYRGEPRANGEARLGDHAEFIALEDKLASADLSDAVVYTTFEPCTKRGVDKTPCANRLVQRRVKRVVIGALDPNPDIRGLGWFTLQDARIPTLVLDDFHDRVRALHPKFDEHQRATQRRGVRLVVPERSGLSPIMSLTLVGEVDLAQLEHRVRDVIGGEGAATSPSVERTLGLTHDETMPSVADRYVLGATFWCGIRPALPGVAPASIIAGLTLRLEGDVPLLPSAREVTTRVPVILAKIASAFGLKLPLRTTLLLDLTPFLDLECVDGSTWFVRQEAL